MAELQKKVLHPPTLPTAIQGDGRYLLTLLRQFLSLQAEQINAANRFTADDVKSDKEGKVLSPRNFQLTFTRLGGHLSWDPVLSAKELSCYEVRTDANVGSETGLLERTTRTGSSCLPVSFVGHIYLFAIDKAGNVSHPAEIHYTKARPTKPKDIAMTKTQEGTLITFLEIPLDCIGAYVYVNDVRYETADNLFLYTDGAVIEVLRVAYYDQYGQGEAETIYCVIPDVKDFIVERNGAQLDFSWAPLSIYNVRYEVKVGVTAEWDRALTIFTTKLNKHRTVYPNTGQYYMLIKAIDEHNNYSRNAAYVFMHTPKDIHQNVILRLDQKAAAYSGKKVHLYYDAVREALLLEKDMFYGEYIIDVRLPQKFRARNWLDVKVIGETNDHHLFDDLDFAWDSLRAQNTMWNGTVGDLRGAAVTCEIARLAETQGHALYRIPLDGTAQGDHGITLKEHVNATEFRDARFHRGLFLKDFTKLSYTAVLPERFSLAFWLKLMMPLSETVLLVLQAHDGMFLRLSYDAGRQEFQVSNKKEVLLCAKLGFFPYDTLAFAVSQSESSLQLYVYSLQTNEMVVAEREMAPLGVFSHIFFYPQ
jgi:hypothetical protein